jgi:hypothetical protein
MTLTQKIPKTKNLTLLHVKSFLASPLAYLVSRLNNSKLAGVQRWAQYESLHDEWDERTALMAGMISPDTTILEFGAGKEHLRQCLPQGCAYQPSDIVARTNETLVCDLNQTFLTLDRKWDVIVFSGVLEYIHDIPKLLKNVRASCDTCILSYAPTDCLECMTTRMRSGWVNHLSRESFETMLKNANFDILEKRTWRGQDIYSLR